MESCWGHINLRRAKSCAPQQEHLLSLINSNSSTYFPVESFGIFPFLPVLRPHSRRASSPQNTYFAGKEFFLKFSWQLTSGALDRACLIPCECDSSWSIGSSFLRSISSLVLFAVSLCGRHTDASPWFRSHMWSYCPSSLTLTPGTSFRTTPLDKNRPSAACLFTHSTNVWAPGACT